MGMKRSPLSPQVSIDGAAKPRSGAGSRGAFPVVPHVSEAKQRRPMPGAFSARLACKSAMVEESGITRRARERLVREMERHESLDGRVVCAMRAVKRHLFVPESMRQRAYEDGPLPIGHGQTISQPTVVALMTASLRLQGDERVLEVGTGSGYQAAVLSHLCREVHSLEVIEWLAQGARAALTAAGCDNVHVHVRDGYAGLQELAPFDGIIITAAPPEVPQALLQQLREGGCLVVPVGPQMGVQDLLVIEKRDGALSRHTLGPVRFVPMVHARVGSPGEPG
jgi:protein-L-isoaspartate(D-aspartate) O-methyltransferase